MSLLQWIIEYNISKRQLADDLEVNESTLYKYINRDRMPRLDIALKIERASNGKVCLLELLPPEMKDDVLKVTKYQVDPTRYL